MNEIEVNMQNYLHSFTIISDVCVQNFLHILLKLFKVVRNCCLSNFVLTQYLWTTRGVELIFYSITWMTFTLNCLRFSLLPRILFKQRVFGSKLVTIQNMLCSLMLYIHLHFLRYKKRHICLLRLYKLYLLFSFNI